MDGGSGVTGRDEGSLCPFHSNGKWERQKRWGGKSLDGLNRRVLQPLPPPPPALPHHQDPGHLAEHLTSPKVRPDQVEHPTA